MIELIKSTFYNEEDTKKKLVDFIAGAKFLSMGKECRQFEEKFAHKQERKYAVYVSSGSMANLVLVQSLINLGRLKKNDRVGVSSLTWATNVMPIIQLGLVPVLIDCEIETLNVSPSTLKSHLGYVDALFLTNVLGFSDNISQIKEMCADSGILFIEDNCESLGSRIDGKLLGNFGVASTFSFFVGHHLSTIEGGMICTDDEELHEMLVITRAHGWDRNLSEKRRNDIRTQAKADNFYAKYLFYELAFNARPTEIGGFIGNVQISYWDEIASKREKNYQDFLAVVKSNDDFIPVCNEKMEIVSSFALPLVCRTKDARDYYLGELGKIAETRPIIAGDISKQPFHQKHVEGKSSCPNAGFVHDNGFYLGNNPEMTEAEISQITGCLKPRKRADSASRPSTKRSSR